MGETTSPENARLTLAERVRSLAYLYQPDDPFTLASGRVSPHFFDMKPVMCDPECAHLLGCLLYTSPSPRDVEESRMPSSA